MKAAWALILVLARPAASQEYGSRGLYPVYETGGQWAIYDKSADGRAADLSPGRKFLVVGERGAGLFEVARSSAAYGGACRARRAARLRTALLRGPRRLVGAPVIAVRAPPGLRLEGSRATYTPLSNQVSEELYRRLTPALRAAAAEEARSGEFRLRPDDPGGMAFLASPSPEKVTVNIDFAARVQVEGLPEALALVVTSQVSASSRRCLRLASGARLAGGCAEMPTELLAETALLRLLAYDPGGKGQPFLLAYTASEPLWGHERWAFLLRPAGPKPLLRDAMDPRCREGF